MIIKFHVIRLTDCSESENCKTASKDNHPISRVARAVCEKVVSFPTEISNMGLNLLLIFCCVFLRQEGNCRYLDISKQLEKPMVEFLERNISGSTFLLIDDKIKLDYFIKTKFLVTQKTRNFEDKLTYNNFRHFDISSALIH